MPRWVSNASWHSDHLVWVHARLSAGDPHRQLLSRRRQATITAMPVSSPKPSDVLVRCHLRDGRRVPGKEPSYRLGQSARFTVLRTHRKQLISCRCALAALHDNSRWKDVEAPSGSDVAARVTSEHEHIALMTRAEPSNAGPNP